MAARSGQRGCIIRKGKFWVVRFRLDVAGQFDRMQRSVRLCPIEGEGVVSKAERYKKALNIITAEGANSQERWQQVEAESCTTTFREQSELWLDTMAKRKRKPVKAKTLRNWKSHLAWINPRIGDAPLSSINNLALKNLVSAMHEAGFKPKTMSNYLQVVKAVVASLVNNGGEPLFVRKWNHEFIDLPIVKGKHQPTVNKVEVEQIISIAKGRYLVMFALLAGTGLRVGETLALEVAHLTDNVLHVRQSLDGRTLVSPKSEAGIREVDLAPELAEMLRAHVSGRTSGFIFRTRKGGPMLQRNVLRTLHDTLEEVGLSKMGFHIFRRFRVTHLRKNRVPEDLIKFWTGHAPETVTDEYSKLKDDVPFRMEVAQQVGLGFNLGLQMFPLVPQFRPAENLQVV